MTELTLAQVRSFGSEGEHLEPTRIAYLNEILAYTISVSTKNYLRDLTVGLMENTHIPIDTIRHFISKLPPAVFTVRNRNRRQLIYDAITKRCAAVDTILARCPLMVLASRDSNGMTPFHYACRHGSIIDIVAIGTRTPRSSLERSSRSGRSPIVDAILSRRGPTVVEAILKFTSDTLLWQTTDRVGFCVFHLVMLSDDDVNTDRILDRVTKLSDLIDHETGRSIIHTAMDNEMPLAYVIKLLGHLQRRCPNLLGDLLNLPSTNIDDPDDIFILTSHCRPVADAIIASIPPSRMHDTLTRRRGLCLATVFHISAEYPYAFVQLVHHGVQCGIHIKDMLTHEGHVSGTVMHAVAEGSFTNFNAVITQISVNCSMTTIIDAMFVSRPHDDQFAFECLRSVRDFDDFMNATAVHSPEYIRGETYRYPIIRHAIRIGSMAVISGDVFAQLGDATVRRVLDDVRMYTECDDKVILIAAQSFRTWNAPLGDVMRHIVPRVNPRNVSAKTERALLIACSHGLCRHGNPNEVLGRRQVIGLIHSLCVRVRAIRNWRRVRSYTRTRWFVNWWFELAARPSYAPGGCICIATQACAMSIMEDEVPEPCGHIDKKNHL